MSVVVCVGFRVLGGVTVRGLVDVGGGVCGVGVVCLGGCDVAMPLKSPCVWGECATDVMGG